VISQDRHDTSAASNVTITSSGCSRRWDGDSTAPGPPPGHDLARRRRTPTRQPIARTTPNRWISLSIDARPTLRSALITDRAVVHRPRRGHRDRARSPATIGRHRLTIRTATPFTLMQA
jgi:hypothetical protein